MKTTQTTLLVLATASALAAAACNDGRPSSLSPTPYGSYQEDPTKAVEEKPGAYAGGQKNTFDHMASLGTDGTKDPFQVLKEREEEGPAEIRTRLHSCQKIQVTTLRSILVGFGVNMDATGDPPTAGQLLKDGILDATRVKDVLHLISPAPSAEGTHQYKITAEPAVPGLAFTLRLKSWAPVKTPEHDGLDLRVALRGALVVGHKNNPSIR